MKCKSMAAAAALLLVGSAAQAQNLDQSVFVTCREAHAMAPDARKALAVYLADQASRYRGVVIPEDDRGTQIAYLVRGGCTLSPDAHLFAVIDKAIVAEMSKLPKRAR